jgi:hypothetical protein
MFWGLTNDLVLRLCCLMIYASCQTSSNPLPIMIIFGVCAFAAAAAAAAAVAAAEDV